MIPNNLIINADDFGLDAASSLGIWHCAQEGLINSISVMAFQNSFQNELFQRLIQNHPQIKIGVHLCLFEGETLPLSFKNLYGKNENPNYKDFLKLYLLGKIKRGDVYTEWKNQIEVIKSQLLPGQHLSHLDSHQHIHMLPGLWPIILRLQKEFDIPRIRIPYESISRSIFKSFPFGSLLQILAKLRWTNEQSRLIGFSGSSHFTLAPNKKALYAVKKHPDCLFELMVHPVLSPNHKEIPDFENKLSFGGVERQNEIVELRQLSAFLDKL